MCVDIVPVESVDLDYVPDFRWQFEERKVVAWSFRSLHRGHIVLGSL